MDKEAHCSDGAVANRERIMIKKIGEAGKVALMAGMLAGTAMLAGCSPAPAGQAQKKTEFNIGWSIYAGWMPWPYADQAAVDKVRGLLKRNGKDAMTIPIK